MNATTTKPSLSADPAARSRVWAIAIGVAILLASAVRIPGMFTDFWVDEIWSFDIARGLTSVSDVFTTQAARIDNNHFLNTWFIYAFGDLQLWWIYRLPALVSGVLTVIVARDTAFRHAGRAGAIWAVLLFGHSFPLVFYSSEARGYSLVVFFAVLGFDLLDRDLARPRGSVATIVGFNACCLLGFMSHLTFIHFFAAAGFWALLRMRRARIPLRTLAWRMLAMFGGSTVYLFLVFRFFIRDITIGGAAPTDPRAVMIESLSTLLGGPHTGALAIAVAVVCAAAFIASLLNLARCDIDRWFFYLLAVVIMPGLLMIYDLLVSERPQPLMPRYFLVPLAFVLLAIAEGTGNLWQAGSPRTRVARRVILAVLAIGFMFGNAVHLFGFLRFGRGGCSRALWRMADQTQSRTIAVTSDDELRGRRVIEFYRLRTFGSEMDVRVISAAPNPADGSTRNRWTPQWLVLTSTSRNSSPPFQETTRSFGGREIVYRYDSSYTWSGFSGVTWYLYRSDRPGGAGAGASDR